MEGDEAVAEARRFRCSLASPWRLLCCVMTRPRSIRHRRGSYIMPYPLLWRHASFVFRLLFARSHKSATIIRQLVWFKVGGELVGVAVATSLCSAGPGRVGFAG